MKKVRRRVVQRQNQDNNEEQTSPQLQSFLAFQTNKTEISTKQQQQHNHQRESQRVTQGRRSEILVSSNQAQSQEKVNTSHMKTHVKQEASVLGVSQIKGAIQLSQISQSNISETNKQAESKGGEDERKSRIELLKQKYLKKTPEIKIQIQKNVQALNAPIVQTPKIQQKYQKNQNLKQIVEQKHYQHNKPEQRSPIGAFQNVKIMASPKQALTFVQPKQNIHKQPISIKQDKEVQKVQEKKVFKVPPPPTKGGKTKPPPPPVTRNHVAQQQEVFVKQHLQQRKPEFPLQVSDGSPELQKQVARPTFVPPPPPAVKSKIPPPPRTALVEDLLAKKAKKQQGKVTDQEQTKIQNVVQMPVQSTLRQQLIKPIERKNEIKQSRSGLVSNKENNIQIQQPTSFSQQIHNWINSPSKNVSKIIYNLDQIIHSYDDSNEKDFTFTSKNQSFNSSINGFINEFILKNKSGLSEGQKSATYTLSLEYFNNLNHLSTQLLLILVKIGTPYLSRHISQVLKNLSQNISKILFNKTYFTHWELSSFVDNILDQNTINQNELLQLFLLSPSQKLISTISSKNINNVQQIIQLLSCIQLIRKENPIIINLYLKFINTLIENLPDDQLIIQLILKHLNQLQTNEKSYQIHKQIKLKLINLLSNSQKPTKQQARAPISEPSKDSGDGGLLGYWNKAVDKIKTATTQLTELKAEKPKPVQQQQQKQEEITYDPVLKRYLINGKVPEDDSSRPSDPTASKLPPPPPPSKNPNRPVPPPLPGKKTRVATNRYA